METFKTRAYVGEDGIFKLEVPTSVTDTELEVVLVVQPVREELADQDAWLAFIEQTAGILSDDPIDRPPQGSYEIREPIE
ncbi:MAG TPA: hypothetical protein PLD57_14095 [Aggregatilineales bacterium]|nr:hypothetical protein [Aggregatilineales bacterium]